MCGRFVGSFTLGALVDDLSVAAAAHGLSLPDGDRSMVVTDDYNVAPTRLVPVVRRDGDSLVLEAMRWGLVPSWAKEVPRSQPVVNARSETVHEKPMFRNLVRDHRCIVPMNGFYEWDRSDPQRKVPYFVPRSDGHLMLSTSIWNRPTVMDGLATCAVLTMRSNEDLAAIHDRAPLQVDADSALAWLTGDAEVQDLVGVDVPRLDPRTVSDAVNSVRNNGPRLIEPFVDDRNEVDSGFGPLFD